MTEYKGWQIVPQSDESNGNRWGPRALVSVFDGGRFYSHDVVALLSLTFDTAQEADDYAVRMAKTWIEDRLGEPDTCALHAHAGCVQRGRSSPHDSQLARGVLI